MTDVTDRPEDWEDVDEADLLPMHPKNAKHSPTTSSTLLTKERKRRALALRLSGATYQQIADELGYASAANASRAVRDEMQKITVEPATELRKIQYARLNTMLLVIQGDVMAGDLKAIQVAQSLMRDMNDLVGLSPDTPHETVTNNQYLVVIDGASDEYVDALMELAGADDATKGLHDGAIAANVVASGRSPSEHTGGSNGTASASP